MSLHVNSCRFIFYSFFQLSTVNLYLFDDLVCNHITSKIVFLHTLITPPGSQRNYTAASAIHMFPLGVCAMQMLQPWKTRTKQAKPTTHPHTHGTHTHAFKGNLEDREDADASRKQPCLP